MPRSTASGATIFDTLQERSAIVDVPPNSMRILRPDDRAPAIGARDFDGGGACLLLLGTTAKSSAIAVAHIAAGSHLGTASENSTEAETERGGTPASPEEVHYMEMVRKTIVGFLKEPDLFQMPLAWAIFPPHEDVIMLRRLQQRMQTVFRHLNVELKVLSCEKRSDVVAVRHGSEATEVYVGDQLIHPRVHSGSLALVLHAMGVRQ